MREHYRQPTREICNALLDYATQQDDYLRQNGDEALIDDKTVFIVKRTRKLPGCSATFTRS